MDKFRANLINCLEGEDTRLFRLWIVVQFINGGLNTIEKTNKTVANVTLRRNFLAALNDFHRDLPNASLMKKNIIYGYRYCGGNTNSLEFMESGAEETKVRNNKIETIDLPKS